MITFYKVVHIFFSFFFFLKQYWLNIYGFEQYWLVKMISRNLYMNELLWFSDLEGN